LSPLTIDDDSTISRVDDARRVGQQRAAAGALEHANGRSGGDGGGQVDGCRVRHGIVAVWVDCTHGRTAVALRVCRRGPLFPFLFLFFFLNGSSPPSLPPCAALVSHLRTVLWLGLFFLLFVFRPS